MRILLTNDDGISALGINILCRELKDIAEVTVVAPAYEQSGTAHGITVNKPLRMFKTEIPDTDSAWSVEGLTADCVKLAIEHIYKEMPDLVISGINHGGNLGTDTIYSGTVSGALEGYINKIPSIAVSVVNGKTNFELAARFVKKICFWWKKNNFQPLTALNINIPGCDHQKIKGYKICKLGERKYTNAFEPRTDPRGRQYFWLHGKAVDTGDKGETDVEAIADNYITVTPLHADLTYFNMIEYLKGDSAFNFDV